MNVAGMLYGPRLLAHVDVSPPKSSARKQRESEIQDLINRQKPLFKGGVGNKGKSS